MGKLIVHMSLSLDGVMQGPGRADEDTRGGFAHGGWANAYFDPAMFERAGKTFATARPALVLGRRTYEDFYDVWPKRPENPFSGMLTAMQKYVASRTLSEPLSWENSTLLKGDAVEAVRQLKASSEQGLLIMGSGELLQPLMRARLVDEYSLLIHPLVLGQGARLFREDCALAKLQLVEGKPTATGVLMTSYRG